jgi:hypothetical protein
VCRPASRQMRPTRREADICSHIHNQQPTAVALICCLPCRPPAAACAGQPADRRAQKD